jgi:hypothetical protein
VLRENGIEHVTDELLACPGKLGDGIELAFEPGGWPALGAALDRNADLLNLRDTKLLRSVTVRGVLGEKAKGRPHAEVLYARRALGIG